jgi:hypothetical protein
MNCLTGARSSRWCIVAAFVLAYGVMTATATRASAEAFSARLTHRGLVVDRSDGAQGRLVSKGWFRRSGEPTLVYREGTETAGVWQTGPEAAVVRSGTTDGSPLLGRIVPTWKDDDELRLTIEPAGATAIRTSVFKRESGGGAATLDRDTSTRAQLAGAYRATLQSTAGDDVGWLRVSIDAEGATQFTGDLPSTIPPALAAAAAAAIDGEVDFIYGNVTDVSPLRR